MTLNYNYVRMLLVYLGIECDYSYGRELERS